MTPRALRLVALTLALAATVAAPTTVRADDPPVAPPPLEAIAPKYDAGRVEAGTQVRHTYELRNRGPRPLQIMVKPGCGCTTTDYDHEIAPGAIGKVTALLDTTHVRGRVEKILDVTTNDPAQPVVTLTIIADSRRALLVEPDDAPGLGGPVGTVKPLTLTVRAADDTPFVVTKVEDDATLRATFKPLDAAVARKHRRYELTLTPKRDLAVGIYHPSLVLVTTAPRAARFEMHPTVAVTGPLVALPPQLKISAGAAPIATRVTAVDGVTFHLLHAKSSDPDFTVALAAVAGEPAWDVTVSYTGKPGRHGPVNAVVQLTTDAPTQPTLLIRLSGKL